MKKTILIILILCSVWAQSQIRVTKEGYPQFPNKQPTATISETDTLMISKVEGIQMGISVAGFLNGAGVLKADGSVPATGNLTTRNVVPDGDALYTSGDETNAWNRIYQYRSVWKMNDGEFFMGASNVSGDLNLGYNASSTGLFTGEYRFRQGGPLSGIDVPTVAWVLANAGGGGTDDQTLAEVLSEGGTATSSSLAGVISDETGSGALMFGTSPTMTSPTVNALGSFNYQRFFAPTAASANNIYWDIGSGPIYQPTDYVLGDYGIFFSGDPVAAGTDIYYLFKMDGTFNINGKGIRNNAGQLQWQNSSDVWTDFGSGGGSDSGQIKNEAVGTTKTYGLSDFLEGGSLTGRPVIHFHSTNDTITLPSGLGQAGRVVRKENWFTGATSVYIKKGVGAILKNGQSAYDVAGITEDGLMAYGDFIIDLLSDGSFKVYSDVPLVAHNESTSAIADSAPLYDFNAESLSVGALATWTNDGTGSADATVATGNPTVVDESGKKAVLFSSDRLTLGTPADMDFVIGTDDFTIMYVQGATLPTNGVVITDRGGTTLRNFNLDSNAADNTFIQIGTDQTFDTGLTKAANWVYEISVDGGVYSTYVEGVVDTSNRAVGTDEALQEVSIGGRSADTNFFDGSIRRILVWNRILTAQERADIFTEIQTSN